MDSGDLVQVGVDLVVSVVDTAQQPSGRKRYVAWAVIVSALLILLLVLLLIRVLSWA